MQTNLRWVATFLVAQPISAEFRKFMEEIHFPTIHASNCFTKTVRRVFNPEIKEGFDSVVYFHEPIDYEAWKKYNEHFRPAARKEFIEKYGPAVEKGDIVMIQSMGELEVFEI